MHSESSQPRYPELRVSVRSRRPMALVAAVREELRHAGARRAEVDRFTEAALTHPDSADHVLEVAEEWVGAVRSCRAS